LYYGVELWQVVELPVGAVLHNRANCCMAAVVCGMVNPPGWVVYLLLLTLWIGGERMTPEKQNYFKNYKKAQRQGEKEPKSNKPSGITFKGKKINVKKFEAAYKDRVKDDATKAFMYLMVLDLVPLIAEGKECIEKYGAFTKSTAGTLKENPAQKSLRENTKTFVFALEKLNSMLGKDDKPNINDWLDDED